MVVMIDQAIHLFAAVHDSVVAVHDIIVRITLCVDIIVLRGGALRLGPEAPIGDDGFSSVFPSDSLGGFNHHMF